MIVCGLKSVMLRETSKSEEPDRTNKDKTKRRQNKKTKNKTKTKHAHNLSKGYEHKSIIIS
jgi:hypothetical protein